MKLDSHITLKNFHHAYLIESDTKTGVEAVLLLLSDFGIGIRGNPDFHHYTYDAFLIEHAETLRGEQTFHGSEGARKIFLVTFNTIMSEAQNALLKTLEEPTAGTHFFFITKTAEVLLPTVRSRMQVIHLDQQDDAHAAEDILAHQFLAGDLAKRMELIAPLTKAKTDEKPQAKEDTRIFLEALERSLYRQLAMNRSVADALGYVLDARRALSERSPSLKMLLEHLALLCPRLEV